MPLTSLFPDFTNDTRCWVYAADRILTDDEQVSLLATCAQFFQGWTSHRRDVRGDAHILSDRFLLLVAHIPDGDISGCGIDKSVHVVERAAQQLGVAWISPLHVFFRDDEGRVQHLPRAAFRKHVRTGAVTADTPVFDLGVATLEALRSGAFEQPAGMSWHARVFRIPQPAA